MLVKVVMLTCIDYRFGKANFKTAAASGMDAPLNL